MRIERLPTCITSSIRQTQKQLRALVPMVRNAEIFSTEVALPRPPEGWKCAPHLEYFRGAPNTRLAGYTRTLFVIGGTVYKLQSANSQQDWFRIGPAPRQVQAGLFA